MELLKRFGMMDYKEMATPMESNLKLLCDASSEIVYSMMYWEMIGSLMYSMKKIPDIYFSINTLIQFLTNPRLIYMVMLIHIGMA